MFAGDRSEDPRFEPTVTVTTGSFAGCNGDSWKIEISVKDNWTGIPDNSIDKIFQPFFTTKLTGQGTWLGLSISYDIIKSHGGDLSVLSNNEG